MSLQAPQNLQASIVSSTEVALTWGAVAGAINYQVSVNGAITDVFLETFGNVSGLSPDTDYEFFVIAEGFDGTETTLSPPSNTVSVTTPAQDPPPPVPGSLATPGIISAEQTGLDAATVTWGAVADATGYEVRVDGGAGADVGNVLGFTTTSSLSAGDHTFEVRAYAGPGPDVFSDWSLPATVTISGLVAPDPSATVLSSGAIEVSWPAIPPADRYQVRVGNDKVFATGSLLEFIDAGLAPLTTRAYEVRGLIDGTALTGPWSAPIEATTNRSVTLEILGRLRRLSTYLSDQHITARSLNAEFNNIYALLAGGKLTVFGPDDTGDSPTPEPDPDADATVSPTNLSFGTRLIGSASPAQTVTVANNAAAPLSLGNMSITGDFLIADDRCSGKTLANGGTCTIGVQFNPAEAGLRLGSLEVPSNDLDSPAEVMLTGTGERVGPPPPPPPPPPPDRDVVTRTLVAETPATSFDVPLGDTQSGDLLVILTVLVDQTVVAPPAGWQFSTGAVVSDEYRIGALVRQADGNEGATVTLTHPSTSGLFFSFVVPAPPASGIPVATGLSVLNTLISWPSIGLDGLNGSQIPAEVAGDDGFLVNLIVLTDFTESGALPGVILNADFPGLGEPVRAQFPGFPAIAVFGADVTLVEGAGAGSMTFASADYDSIGFALTLGWKTA